MSFTYSWSSSPQIAQLRLMIGDTDATPPGPFYQDEEITGVLQTQSSQNIIVGLTGFSLAVPPAQIFSFGRAAAMLLNGLSAVRARNLVKKLLDVELDGQLASKYLKDLGQGFIDQECSAGYFAVSEMCPDSFSARERLRNMLYRQST